MGGAAGATGSRRRQEPTPKKSPRRRAGRVLHAQLHQVRIPDPHARRHEALHPVYMPKDASQSLSDHADRTPYSVAPYGADNYRDAAAPEKFAKENFIFVYQDVRGRYMSEGEFVNVRPHLAVKNGPKDIDESTDTYDTIDWLVKNVPTTTARSACGASRIPASTPPGGMIDAHPALKAARRRRRSPIGSSATTSITTARSSCRTCSASSPASASPGRARRRPAAPTTAFDHGTPDGYDFFLAWARSRNVDPRNIPRRRRVLERDDAARSTTTSSGRPATCGRT